MIKKILKEAGIVVLILIAIALVLSIIFYEYIPSSKTVPVQIEAYTLPEDVEEELKESITEGQNIVKTLYIDSTDLNGYESTKEYNKGKANPFADYTQDEDNTETSNNNSNKNNTNTNNNNNTNSNTNSNSSNGDNDKEQYVTTPGKNY